MKGQAHGAWGERLRALFDKYKFVLLVILAGVVLLLLPSFGGKEQAQADDPGRERGDQFQVENMERRLEEALSKVEGAGETTVVLSLKSTARQILAQDGESAERGDTMESALTTVVISKGSGNQEAVALQQLSPQYQGALVVCSGGDDPNLRLRIVEAVSALTGLGADKISVCKGK